MAARLRDDSEPHGNAKILIANLNACTGKSRTTKPPRVVRKTIRLKREPERCSIQPSVAIQILKDSNRVCARQQFRKREAYRRHPRWARLAELADCSSSPPTQTPANTVPAPIWMPDASTYRVAAEAPRPEPKSMAIVNMTDLITEVFRSTMALCGVVRLLQE